MTGGVGFDAEDDVTQDAGRLQRRIARRRQWATNLAREADALELEAARSVESMRARAARMHAQADELAAGQ